MKPELKLVHPGPAVVAKRLTRAEAATIKRAEADRLKAEKAFQGALAKIDCGKCIAPGTCCKAIPINIAVPITATAQQVDEELSRRLSRDLGEGQNPGPNPFRAIRRQGRYDTPYATYADGSGESVQWLFECTALAVDGRCGIYDFRPWLCRRYQPGWDTLCVHALDRRTNKPVIPQARVRQF